jgi:hypothetical protein
MGDGLMSAVSRLGANLLSASPFGSFLGKVRNFLELLPPKVTALAVDVIHSSGPQQLISRSDSFQHIIKRELSTSQYSIRRV